MIDIKVIGNKSPEPIMYAYMITCSAMFGDGDLYEPVTLPIIYATDEDGKWKEELEEVIRLLDTMAVTEIHDDSTAYEKLDGFEKWFDGGDLWPMDPIHGYDDPATFAGYEVTYYDEWAETHSVKITIV